MLDHGFDEGRAVVSRSNMEGCVVDNVEGCVDVCPCCDHEGEVNELLTQMRVSLQYLITCNCINALLAIREDLQDVVWFPEVQPSQQTFLQDLFREGCCSETGH